MQRNLYNERHNKEVDIYSEESIENKKNHISQEEETEAELKNFMGIILQVLASYIFLDFFEGNIV